jgi:hypothetical protein
MRTQPITSFEWLGDARLDDRSGGSGIDTGDGDLGRNDIGELRDRDAQKCKRAGDRNDQRDDDCEPRAIDKGGRSHL